jgi:hypothetical protein
MLPDVGAGNTLTHLWWLAVIVLFVCTVGAGSAVAVVTVSLQRKSQSDESQNQAITELQDRLHKCQVHCASSRGDYVKREDFEGRMLRQEEMIVRIHERVDQIAIKLGLIDDARKIG